MDISYFREFAILAETKNYWAASERLFIGQSSLSKHIKAMEKQLGSALFERTSRKVELTEFGALMLPYAQSISRIQYEYETAAFNHLNQGTEVLHIASIPVMAHYGITDILLRFQTDFPTVQIHTSEADTLKVREWLIERRCELAFFRDSVAYLEHDPDKERLLVKHPYSQDRLVAVLAKNHPLAENQSIELAQLSEEQFVLLQNGSMPYSLCMRACQEAGFTPRVVFTSHNLEALLDMVLKGDCVSLLFAGHVDFPRPFLNIEGPLPPPTPFGGPRDEAEKYLARGMVYVTCGCRGRESRDSQGKLCGKSPWALVDLKTGIRFLRHNAAVLPGDFSRIISVGWSAGGAMSSLVGITGDDSSYLPFLEQNGAFMDESDAVYAAQIYCPIVDLDHADLAYEWQFQRDTENESSPAGPAGVMTPFQEALSEKLSAAYVNYFNSLGLKHPDTGVPLILNGDSGRSGSGYDYLMSLLEDSATDYLTRLERGELPEKYCVQDYLLGRYTHQIPAPPPAAGPDAKPGKDDLGLHHAGAAVMMSQVEEGLPEGKPLAAPPSLGDLVSRPPKGVPYVGLEFPMMDVPGNDKTGWLTWDGQRAHISSLDDYVLNHRRRMKPCTSFDTLGMDSGENQEFGTPEQDYMHFSEYVAPAIAQLKDQFPDEYARYYDGFAKVAGDEALSNRRKLINPMDMIGSAMNAADFFRIRVGACDADTAFTISMALALKLAEAGKSVDYALVWDRPHCEADYSGEVCDWIERIC